MNYFEVHERKIVLRLPSLLVLWVSKQDLPSLELLFPQYWVWDVSFGSGKENEVFGHFA